MPHLFASFAQRKSTFKRLWPGSARFCFQLNLAAPETS